jgi:hypothetical protein
VQDSELYKLAVVADSAFDISARTNGEMHEKYRQLFAHCSPFLCARWKLLQDPRMDFTINQLEKYEPLNTSLGSSLTAMLRTRSRD